MNEIRDFAMASSVFIRRVRAKNFKSIAACDVELGPLSYLVGPNGSGKSNFLDVLHFVKDALQGSLENALHLRGGLSEVRRRSGGHPNHFGVRLDFRLPDGRDGRYAFNIGARPVGGFEVQQEECAIAGPGGGPSYRVVQGAPERTSEEVFPVSTPDRLALVNAGGLPAFRPVFDALSRMTFYNLNPRVIRDLQKPQDGSALKSLGENIASVLAFMERQAPEDKALVEDYLKLVVPSVQGVERTGVGHMETLVFRQDIAGSKQPWRFPANSMSDGTLRALGILVALYQGGGSGRPSVVGIEEPEVALHPAAAAVVRDALTRAATRSQILVTSHSPELLDDASVEEFHRHVLLAAAKAGDGTVLVLLDADDDCPAELAAAIETRAREVAGPVRLAVVLANREYDAWFLAGVASLAGKRGLPETLQAPVAAEAIRNAKGWLGERMASRGYHPVSDQPALSAMLDIDLACAHSRSFRKFVKECERALAE